MRRTVILCAAAGMLLLSLLALLIPLEPHEPRVPAPISAQPNPPTPEPESESEPEPEPKTLTLVATGDLMAHIDQVWDAQTAGGGYDFTHCFAEVRADLEEGYAIGNLETVFGGPEIGPQNYPQFSTPDEYGYALKENGLDFVSTCNNHSLDWYEAGALRTLEVLDDIGFAHTGTYPSFEDQNKLTVVEAEGFRIAVLAYTFSTNGIPMPEGKEYLVNMISEGRIASDLAKARALGPDLIVVMPHMGEEYEEYTQDVFLDWMDFMLYHGADIVLASHPHVLQPMMMRQFTDVSGEERQGFIIASLGNFISCQRDEPREISIILKLDISQEPGERSVIEKVRFVPTWVQYKDVTGSLSIRVLPVGDAIASLKNPANPYGLSPANGERLFRANGYITKMFLGEAVAGDKLQREYIFYEREAGASSAA